MRHLVFLVAVLFFSLVARADPWSDSMAGATQSLHSIALSEKNSNCAQCWSINPAWIETDNTIFSLSLGQRLSSQGNGIRETKEAPMTMAWSRPSSIVNFALASYFLLDRAPGVRTFHVGGENDPISYNNQNIFVNGAVSRAFGSKIDVGLGVSLTMGSQSELVYDLRKGDPQGFIDSSLLPAWSFRLGLRYKWTEDFKISLAYHHHTKAKLLGTMQTNFPLNSLGQDQIEFLFTTHSDFYYDPKKLFLQMEHHFSDWILGLGVSYWYWSEMNSPALLVDVSAPDFGKSQSSFLASNSLRLSVGMQIPFASYQTMASITFIQEAWEASFYDDHKALLQVGAQREIISNYVVAARLGLEGFKERSGFSLLGTLDLKRLW